MTDIGTNYSTRARWRSCLLLAIALTPLSVTQPVAGATYPDLYSINVPISAGVGATTGARSQDANVRIAMGQLLTRVTGRRDAAFEPALAVLLDNARDYVEQIGQIDRETLRVTFDARSVEAMLVRLDQPLWGVERPMTLAWIAVDAGLGQRELLAADPAIAGTASVLSAELDRLRDELEAVAEERGLLLTLPLLDLQDMNALSFVDVWGGFNDQIQRASDRYAVDDVLVGRVRLEGFGPAVQWVLLKGGRAIMLPGQTLREGLDALADLYASELSTFGRASSSVITVIGIDSLEDYGRVMRYMESLSVLEIVLPEELAAGSLRLRVGARGDQATLRRVLEIGGTLRPVPGLDALTFALVPRGLPAQ
jgi:hypothetical protein